MTETVAVVGLGYVGLPLAVAFGQKQRTIGFDINHRRVADFQAGRNPVGDVDGEELRSACQLIFTDDPAALEEADYVVVAVPTPIDAAHQPDLVPLRKASTTVGQHLKQNATVIYESTVYPGCTEEVCVPILEGESGKRWKQDFHVGYSPERINPGDTQHRLKDIVKVVAGDTPATLERVSELYRRIISAGVHPVTNIQVAEAAKVIENAQRDLNIAFVNELAIIFNRLGIDTSEVLAAAGTKWNFLPFRPGLVGGHCIGVDPYYLTHKAEIVGYHPEVILAGRRINDGMGKYVAEQTIKRLIASGGQVKGANISVLGLTFKEDCPDIRNTRVIDIIRELESYSIQVSVHDPTADPAEAEEAYGVKLSSWDDLPRSDAIVCAVAHSTYRELQPEQILAKLNKPGNLMDVKWVFDPNAFEGTDVRIWRL